jgi:antitoxin HicB
MNVLYPAHFHYDKHDKRYTVIFPDLSEAITEAETREEAFLNAAEVLTLTLESRIEEGMKIPFPSKIKNAELIAPSARIQSLLLTKWALRNVKKTSNRLPTLLQLEQMALKMGQRLVLSLEPAVHHH